MAIAAVTQWLDGPRVFSHGRALYEQYGSDPVVLTIIRTGTSSYHLGKLVAALEEINKLSNIQPKPIVIGDLEATPSEKSSPDLMGAPDELWKIRAEKNLAYARARKLYEAIRINDSRSYRLEAAIKLLDEMDSVNESWSVIDEWKETGNVRDTRKRQTKMDIASLSMPELIRQERNLQTYISKDKAKLDGADDPASRAKIAIRLDERRAQLEQIRRRLNGFV